jgi:plastocyanin
MALAAVGLVKRNVTPLALCGAAIISLGVPCAHAEEHIVRTRRAEWVPSVLFIEPGDTVVWQGMSTHETELIEGMGPEGGFAWNSEIDAEGFSVTLDVEGAYIYSCDVHMNFGMVGAIVVGDGQPANLAAIDAALPAVEIGRVFVGRIIDRMKRVLSRRN